jgi:hypothetical protein
MSGPKNKGDLVNRLSAPGEFDPKGSRINFSVPFAKVTGTSESQGINVVYSLMSEHINQFCY